MLLLHAVAAALGECHSDISDSGSLNEEERGLWIELAQLLQAMPTLTTFLQPPATLEWAFAASQSPLVPHVKAGDRVMITPQRLVRPSWLEPQAWPGWHLTRHLRSFTTLLPMMRDAEELVVSRLTMGDLCVYAQTCKAALKQAQVVWAARDGKWGVEFPGTVEEVEEGAFQVRFDVRRGPRAAQALERRSALERDLDLYAATADERFDVELDHDDRHLLDNEYSWVSSVVGDKWRVIRQ